MAGRPQLQLNNIRFKRAAALAVVVEEVRAPVNRRFEDAAAGSEHEAVPARRVAPALRKIEAIALWRERQEAQAAFVAARPSLVRILLGECSSLLLPCCGEER